MPGSSKSNSPQRSSQPVQSLQETKEAASKRCYDRRVTLKTLVKAFHIPSNVVWPDGSHQDIKYCWPDWVSILFMQPPPGSRASAEFELHGEGAQFIPQEVKTALQVLLSALLGSNRRVAEDTGKLLVAMVGDEGAKAQGLALFDWAVEQELLGRVQAEQIKKQWQQEQGALMGLGTKLKAMQAGSMHRSGAASMSQQAASHATGVSKGGKKASKGKKGRLCCCCCCCSHAAAMLMLCSCTWLAGSKTLYSISEEEEENEVLIPGKGSMGGAGSVVCHVLMCLPLPFCL